MRFFKILFVSLLLPVYVFANNAQEQLSAQTGFGDYDYTVISTFNLKHRDGSPLVLNLIKFNKPVCATATSTEVINGATITNVFSGCVGGFTHEESDYTRKRDPEHPTDTTETVSLTFIPGAIPKIRQVILYHELFHAVDFHWHSRSVCETNWRYSECMESQAYDYTDLLDQVQALQNKRKIKLI